MMKKKKKPFLFQGFTLAELLVVIAILAVLATIGFVSLSQYAGDARMSVSKANVRSVYSLISAESAVNSVSPRYYVVHDSAMALSWSVSIVFGGHPSELIPGPWGDSNANYSAGTPDFAKLKLDPEKFRTSHWTFLPTAFADSPVEMFVAAADVLEGTGSEARPQFFLQSAAVLEDGNAFVVGNYVPPSEGSPAGLIANPSGTGALIDGSAVPDLPSCDSGHTLNRDSTPPECVPNSGCGTSHGVSTVVAPSSNLCSAGTASEITANAENFTWTCTNHPSPTSSCSAARQYVVTFDTNGGSLPTPSSKTVDSGGTLWTLPSVSRTGYSFGGWFTQASGGEWVSDSTVVTQAFTAYAQWTELAYSVSGSFGSNGSWATVSVCGANVTADASGNFSRSGIPYGTACDNVIATRTNYACSTTFNGPESLVADVTNVAGGCVANTKTFACGAKPATGTDWNTVSSYLQTWNGSAWFPADSATAYNATASTESCRYKCSSGYGWNGSSCVTSYYVMKYWTGCGCWHCAVGNAVTGSCSCPAWTTAVLRPWHPYYEGDICWGGCGYQNYTYDCK